MAGAFLYVVSYESRTEVYLEPLNIPECRTILANFVARYSATPENIVVTKQTLTKPTTYSRITHVTATTPGCLVSKHGHGVAFLDPVNPGKLHTWQSLPFFMKQVVVDMEVIRAAAASTAIAPPQNLMPYKFYLAVPRPTFGPTSTRAADLYNPAVATMQMPPSTNPQFPYFPK